MISSSRGLVVSEAEERPIIENLSEHSVNSMNELRSHVHHAFQIRKNIIKPDPRLKLKSHLIVQFTLYENLRFLSQIGLIELAGSENASNDTNIIKSNSLSPDEKKCIARNLNALSAVLNNEHLWKESSLTMCCRRLLDSRSNKVLLCTVSSNPVIYKHTLASLKYASRIRQGAGRNIQRVQQGIKADLQRLRSEIKNSRDTSTGWISCKEGELLGIEKELRNNIQQLGGPQEIEEFLMECEMLCKQLRIMRNRPVTPINHQGLRRKSASPIAEEVTTDRDGYLRQKLVQIQIQSESQIRKIEDLTAQISQRDEEIRNCHGRIGELEKYLYEKDRFSQEQDCKINELNKKIVEYSKKCSLLRDESSKKINNAQYSGNREGILENQLQDLEKRLYKDREDFSLQIQKLKTNIQVKDKTIHELQSSGSNCANEKDSVIQDLKQKLKAKTIALSDMEKQLLSLSNNYNESRFKLEVESSSSKKYEEECLILRRKIEETGMKLNSTESKNLLLIQRNESVEKELISVRQEVDCRKFKAQQLSASLKEMENTINASAEESIRIKFEINQLRSENQMLRVDKENFYNENCDLREENRQVKEELKNFSGKMGENNQYLNDKEKSLQEFHAGGPQLIKKKKKKIKSLKENISLLQQQLKDCQAIAEEEIKKALDERDQILAELEECKGSQIVDLSMVENQVEVIEDQLMKLKEQNKQLQARESELVRELRNAEAGKENDKEMIVEMKEEIKLLQAQLAEMDEYVKEYINNHRKEISEIKSGEEKTLALKSRIRAMHDVKNMILAHRVQR